MYRHLLLIAGLLAVRPVLSEPDALSYQTHLAEVADEVFALRVPDGYALQLLTTELQRPRLLVFDHVGNMLIGSRSGHIYRLKPPYTEPEYILILADYPHSLALRGEYLYIAQTTGLYRIPYKPAEEIFDEADVELVAGLPGGWGHNSRTVKVGPDGRIYLALGITGNCSDEYLGEGYTFDKQRGGVMVLDEASQPPTWQHWASGLRNPIGFDWHPQTGVMYASNNGPDHLGFNQPPESFSRLDKGSFHGMPWFRFDGGEIRRDDCLVGQPPEKDVMAPAATFPARNAPMAVTFIESGHLENNFYGDAVVALHGSWATRPDGDSTGDPSSRRPPKLVLVRFEQGKAIRVDDFISGFQNLKGRRMARPVGTGIGPDGNLYFTSDGGIDGLFRLEKIAP